MSSLKHILKRCFKCFTIYTAYALVGLIVVSIFLVLPLRWLNPPTTAFVLRDDRVKSVWLNSQWVAMVDISSQLQLAVIASEDQKFPHHYGFDFEALKAVLSEPGGPSRGASTITQQLVKNLYLWPKQSIFRKLCEAYLTVLVEAFWSKERILEVYLNVVEFGPGVFGVADASNTLFNRSPKSLDRTDASLLAAVLPSPKKMSAARPSAYVYGRAYTIRESMWALGGVAYLPWLSEVKGKSQ